MEISYKFFFKFIDLNFGSREMINLPNERGSNSTSAYDLNFLMYSYDYKKSHVTQKMSKIK